MSQINDIMELFGTVLSEVTVFWTVKNHVETFFIWISTNTCGFLIEEQFSFFSSHEGVCEKTYFRDGLFHGMG